MVDFVSYQKNANSENVRVGRICREKCQKNKHSETVELAGFPEKKGTELECCCLAEPIEAIAIQSRGGTPIMA